MSLTKPAITTVTRIPNPVRGKPPVKVTRVMTPGTRLPKPSPRADRL
jgi:hypothetical protein